MVPGLRHCHSSPLSHRKRALCKIGICITKRRHGYALIQRDAIVGHAEAIRTQSRKPSKAHTHKKPWLGMRKQSGAGAGNHQSNTRVLNTSPPTRATIDNPPTRPLYMHLTRTPSGVLCLCRAWQNDAYWYDQLKTGTPHTHHTCLLYTSDAADE